MIIDWCHSRGMREFSSEYQWHLQASPNMSSVGYNFTPGSTAQYVQPRKHQRPKYHMPIQSNNPVPPELAWSFEIGSGLSIHDGRPPRRDEFVFVHLETSIVGGWHF
ncbi:unnamed protein product [Sphenostylis stenocarpa]|uniref:Uncharacterized protein n=1 Tax=Sphenostylis stenocarpa TaxID=92480 RepID=A0AA86VK73_9FABA|nr:unnamed protein product [Sphenostylis stenocarpa]